MNKQKHEGTFWGRVDKVMERRRMTYATLSNTLGIGYKRIIMQRHRCTPPSLGDALAIADVLGVRIEYLATGEQPGSNGNVLSFRKFADIEADLISIEQNNPKEIQLVRRLIDVILKRSVAPVPQKDRVLEFPVRERNAVKD